MSPRFRLALLLPACTMLSGLGAALLLGVHGTEAASGNPEASLGLALLWALAVAALRAAR